MLPIPTRNAILAVISGTALLLFAVLSESLLAGIFGGTVLTAVSFSFAGTYALARNTRRKRLEFAWWRERSNRSAVTARSEFFVRCYLRHRGESPLRIREIQISAPEHCHAELVDVDGDLLLHPGYQHEFEIRVVPAATGRLVLQGLSVTVAGSLDLFKAALYFPNPVATTVWPAPKPAPGRKMVQRGSLLTAEGRGRLRRRGPQGTEFRELRKWLPGDPFRSIAWKASARRNELLVRLTETEPTIRRWLVIDASGTMRDGPPGDRRLDVALSIATQQVMEGIRADETIGLMSVDGRITQQEAPGRGPRQQAQLLSTLVDLADMNDPDLTAADEDDVLAIVGRYLLGQYGYDYSSGPSAWNRKGILAQVRKSDLDGTPHHRTTASADEALRSYCRHRGIAIPYRQAPLPGMKEKALGSAIERAAHDREAAAIMVLTDFEGIEDMSPIVRATQLAHRRRHQVTFLVPTSPSAQLGPSSTFATRMRTPFKMAETRRLNFSRDMLRKVGAAVEVIREPPRGNTQVQVNG